MGTSADNLPSGYFDQGKNFEDNGFVKRAWAPKVEGDLDGDGHVSLAERFDTDGDGKISMEEYAATTNLPGDNRDHEVWTANSVGAPKEERMGWAMLRQARTSGRFVPTIAERVRATQDSMIYNPTSGGWEARKHVASPRSPETQWGGPKTPDVNRNVRDMATVANQAMASRIRRL